jgi:hypothetical protein
MSEQLIKFQFLQWASKQETENKEACFSLVLILNLFYFFPSAIFQVGMIVLFGIFIKYDDNPVNTLNNVNHNYELYKDVAVMIFIGFGFLMTFLKKYGYSLFCD